MKAWAVIGTIAGTIALSVLPGVKAFALTPDKTLAQLSAEGWQVKDGLPGDSIRAIAQASDGRLWIAAFGGLVRYDGSRFAAVDAPDDLKPAMADVSVVLAARDGSVWLGSNHHPPMQFANGKVRAFGIADGLPKETLPLAWAEDGQGHIWLVSKHGLYRFADDRFIARPVRGLGEVTATRLQIDASGTPWIGTATGLYTVAGDRLVRPAGGNVTEAVTALHIDDRRVLWAAAAGGLVAIEDGKVVTTLTSREGLPGADIAQIEHDDDGNLWLATVAGLIRVRDGRATAFTGNDGLPTSDVTALLVDRERGLWVGTRSSGLVLLTDRTLDTHAGPPGLEGEEPLAVCEDDQDALWFGTHGHGAVRWKDGKATWYTRSEGLPADWVSAALPGAPGEVWLGTHDGLVRWRAGKIDDPGFWKDRVRTLYRDRHGAIWIGGNGVLGRYADGALVTFTPQQGVMTGSVRALAEDADGVLWVSGVGGLIRRSGDRFVKATALAEKTAGAIRSMLLDSQGAFWLTTTRRGLLRIQHGQTTAFDARVGLEPDMLYGLLEDDGGDLWIGTNKSILRVARSSLEAVADQRHPTVQVASFETSDRRAGIVAAQLHQPSAIKARDGSLWFLTQNGTVRIDPRAMHVNTVLPRATVDAVLADGRSVAPGGRSHLPHGPGRVEFQYSTVSLMQPSKVRFRHWLEGFDPGWVDAGDRKVAVYANLPTGDYRFRVQASNNDGVWNEHGANFSFAVDPPFYARIWFYLGCALALLPIGLLIHRSHLARLRAQYLGMFTERSRMARELHDTLLQGMSTVAMQLHSLRSHFNDAAPGPRRELDLLHETVTRCLHETRRVVRGLRDDERSQGALGPALTRLAQRLRSASAPSGPDGGVADAAVCEVQIEGQPRPLPHTVQNELYRIGQEALTNALRHAEARRIELRLCYEAQVVRLVVSDDGRGFDTAAIDRTSAGAVTAEAEDTDGTGAAGGRDGAQPGLHFGIRGLRERAARIGATLDVRSAVGAGTVVETIVTVNVGMS